MNIINCGVILIFSLITVGCSSERSSNSNPASSSKSKPASHEDKKKEFILPGGCSFLIPDSFSSRERDSNFIEFFNHDGIPSIFVTTYNVKDYSPEWIALLPNTFAAAIQFRAEQEIIENAKTLELKEYGLDCDIVKWNAPYPLPHLTQPSFGIDYVRHHKSSVLGQHQEGRAFCINIQILNGQYLYTFNMRHITTPDISVEANMPDQYYDIIQSIRIESGNIRSNDIVPLNNDPAASLISPVRYPSWNTVSLPGICEYQIPPTMELQAGIYRELATQIHTQVLQVLDTSKRIVSQQKGLNTLNKDAFSKYARVVVEYKPDTDEYAQLLSNPFIIDRDFISDIDAEMKSLIIHEAARSTAAGLPVEITSWDGVQVVAVNGLTSLKATYSRSIKGKPPVSVRSFRIPHNDMILSVTISYRISEANLWESDLDNVIKTFIFSQK